MKKLFTLAFALIFFTSFLQAQTSGGPDAFGYVWRDNNDTLTPGAPVYNWIDIVGLPNATQVKSLGDDNTAGPNPIGFPFHYYWYDRSTFIIGSNGYIIFNGLGALAAPFLQIPLASLPQDFISAFASDITFTDQFSVAVPNADCWFYTTPGNDSLIVSWISVPFYDQFSPGHYQGENTFQMILTSVDSSITFQYMTQIGVYQNTTEFLTIGIENVSGTVGLQHSHDIYPTMPKAIKFYYPASTSLVITDAATSWNDNPTTGAIFLSQNGSDFTLTTQVENAGNVTIPNQFNVTSQIINSGGSVVVTNTSQADTLTPGQTQIIVQPNTFTPAIAGTYRFSSTTQLANDLVSSNNLKIQEVRVIDTTTASIPLQYEDGITSSGTPLSWGGGSGGAGYYYVPPFYPCFIDSVKAFIASNAQAVDFFMEVYDDDGPFNNPGTRLDSQLVVNPQPVATGDWFSVAMPTPIQIDSGGFYVSWNMSGDDIQLGIDINIPFSNRTYEVLGSSWAVFRYRETQDLMIRAVCSAGSGSGIKDHPSADFGDFYPNPSDNEVSVKFTMGDAAKDITYSVYDIQGKVVYESRLAVNGAGGIVSIPTSEMKAGVYNCKFIIDGKMLNRRFVVAK